MASLRSKIIFNRTIKFIRKFSDKHYLNIPENREKLEQEVLKTVKKHPDILTVQDEKGKNLGMYACEYRLSKVAILALQNEEAAVQQDQYGHNIGMYAAELKIEEVVLIALDNSKASVQQTKGSAFYPDYNIGMYAADNELKQATLKALQNPVAVQQLDGKGETIYDKAKRNGLLFEESVAEEHSQSEPVEEEEEEIPQAISDLHEDIFGNVEYDEKRELKDNKLPAGSEKNDNSRKTAQNVETRQKDDERKENKGPKETKSVISDIYDDIFGN